MAKRNMGQYLNEAKWAVEDAIHNGNYRELSSRLSSLAGEAIHEFNESTGSFCGKDESDPFDDRNRDDNEYRGESKNQSHGNGGQGGFGGGQAGQPGWGSRFERHQRRNERNVNRDSYRKYSQYARTNKVNRAGTRTVCVPKKKIAGRISSIVYTVLGSIGTFGFGTATIALTCIYLYAGVIHDLSKLLAVIFGISTLGFYGVLSYGLRKKRLIRRYTTYQSMLEKKHFCEIKRLAEYVGKSEKYVIRDLKKMMVLNMFQEAHFNEQKTLFVLGDDNYEHYVQAEQSFAQRQKESVKENEKESSKVVNEDLEKAIAEGKRYIQNIRKANDDIPGEEISKKLDRLEEVITKIFFCVEKHPEKLPEIRKFMEYYLPITLKLVNAYKEFDSQTIQGENIKNSKQEIENTLDTIELAFEKLLDSLYENEAMEVSSDISTLNALFAQEGLTKKDFDFNK